MIFFEVLMCARLREVESVLIGLRRAIAGRVEASSHQAREHEGHSSTRVGLIAQQRVETYRSRQP